MEKQNGVLPNSKISDLQCLSEIVQSRNETKPRISPGKGGIKLNDNMELSEFMEKLTLMSPRKPMQSFDPELYQIDLVDAMDEMKAFLANHYKEQDEDGFSQFKVTHIINPTSDSAENTPYPPTIKSLEDPACKWVDSA